ncbi:MAG: hypothetical protein J6K77_03510 [Ruminococcus sp.]|nr:hypothetical protein [Ruminococcus sp.]
MAEKKNNSKKKAGGVSAYTLFCVVIGIIGGVFLSRYSDKLEDAGLDSLLTLPIILIWFYLAYFIELIIHETGHMVMGLLTGYKFLSFRIGSFTIMKENGRLVRKKFKVPGTAGQCLLSPKETEHPEDLPFFWYNFGGVFFNLLTGAIAVTAAVLADNIYVVTAAVIFAVSALLTALVNGIPARISGVLNDGYNIRLMMKDPAERTVIYKSFLANARMYRGERPEDMAELFSGTEAELKTEHGIALSLTEGTLHLYRHQYDRAEEIFRSAAEDESVVQIYRMEAKCELLFCLVMLGAEQEKIAGLYDKELQKYIQITGKTMIARKRLMYAYYLLFEKSAEKAQAEYDAALKMEKTYPAKGEYLSEMDLINHIRSENAV